NIVGASVLFSARLCTRLPACMARVFLRPAAAILATGVLSSLLGSAAPPAARASGTPTSLVAAAPIEPLDRRPNRFPSAARASAATSRASFIAALNAKAARLGLRSTHFANPTGLDAPGHYSSAYDLALAAIYLESHYSGLVAIAATPAITIPATTTHKAFALVNINKLLHTYPGTYGLKTGWTDAALGCLITTSSRSGHRLLAVLLGAPNGTAYGVMPKVLDYGL